jgi:hypothetical protein
MTETTAKTAIHALSQGVQDTVAKFEQAAVSAVERGETAFAGVKNGFEATKAVATEAASALDAAGRSALSGAVAAHQSLLSYGRDVLADSIETGRKTFEAKSVKDVIESHTAFAERRINAYFQTVGALNSLAQANAVAMWSPFAALLKTASGEAQKAAKDGLKIAA